MSTAYFLLIILASCTQSTFSKLYIKKSRNVYIFNIGKSLLAFIAFGLLGIFLNKSYSVHIPTLIYSAVFGVFMFASMYFGYLALVCGPMSVTSTIVSFSLVIPTAYGIIVLDEPLTAYKAIGFILLATSLLLFNAKKKDERKASVKWLIFTLLTLVSNGLGSVLQKMHQISFPGQHTTEFMRDSMLLCLVGYVVLLLLLRLIKKDKNEAHNERVSAGGIVCSLFAGITNAANYFFTLLLTAKSDASALFPMISAGTIIALFISGRLIFGEKHRSVQILALLFGMASMVLLKL
jgi:drug/metabolite transporter (DMT)-like permease